MSYNEDVFEELHTTIDECNCSDCVCHTGVQCTKCCPTCFDLMDAATFLAGLPTGATAKEA